MDSEQALITANHAVNSKIARTLTEVEIALLFGAWNNLTYEQIATRSGYSINYLQRDIGPKFWKLLSDALGRKVNKTNLRGILSQFTPPIPNRQPQNQRSVDWGEAIDVASFCGREEEIENLTQWIIAERCHLIALVGMGGIGKSALAAKASQLVQTDFEFLIWSSLRNAPPLETLLAELVPFLVILKTRMLKGRRNRTPRLRQPLSLSQKHNSLFTGSEATALQHRLHFKQSKSSLWLKFFTPVYYAPQPRSGCVLEPKLQYFMACLFLPKCTSQTNLSSRIKYITN